MSEQDKQCREAFERWFECDCMPLESDWFKRDDLGFYSLDFVEKSWAGWLAAWRYLNENQ